MGIANTLWQREQEILPDLWAPNLKQICIFYGKNGAGCRVKICLFIMIINKYIRWTSEIIKDKCFVCDHMYVISVYIPITFQIMLCRTVTILYLCLVRLDKMHCSNISWIQPIKPHSFSVTTNMGIRYITSALLRNYVNMTVRKRTYHINPE